MRAKPPTTCRAARIVAALLVLATALPAPESWAQGANEATNASGAVMVPTGSDPACTGARPIVLYAHGTTTDRNYNIADIIDPAKPGAAEGSLMGAMYAAQGFIVVAPNYAGYDVSKLPYHPYLNADQQSKEMIDALAAARKALPNIGSSDSGKLLLTGYSQGGHVAMATHRALQAAGQTVTASAPMLSAFLAKRTAGTL